MYTLMRGINKWKLVSKERRVYFHSWMWCPYYVSHFVSLSGKEVFSWRADICSRIVDEQELEWRLSFGFGFRTGLGLGL